jgi:broad specificity phosphatase PhoE
MCIAPPNGSHLMLPHHTFFFLRHGQTDWNAQGRIQGHTDMPLNETGMAQARAAAGRLAGHGIDCIVSSPLARAHKTAGFVAERLRLPVQLDGDLKERSFGAFEEGSSPSSSKSTAFRRSNPSAPSCLRTPNRGRRRFIDRGRSLPNG